MKSVVTCLGFVSEIRYTDLNGDDYELNFRTKNSWNVKTGKDAYLMVAESSKVISLLPWENTKVTTTPERYRSQKALYCDWSGYDQTEAFKVEIPRAEPHQMGYITRIEYTSDKFERKGDRPGKFSLYRHTFKKRQKLYSNRAENIYAIVSKQTLVNYRGIIG